MIPQRYEPERHNVAMVAHPEGRFVLCVDAEKWVREKEEQFRYDEGWYLRQIRLKDEITLLKNERDEALRKSTLDQKQCDEMTTEATMMAEEIAALKIEILRTLVDGASDIVEIYPAESPAQKEWRDNWLTKAREVLK